MSITHETIHMTGPSSEYHTLICTRMYNQTLREHVNGEMSETPRITVNRCKSLGHILLYFRSGYRILSAPVMVDKPERKL